MSYLFQIHGLFDSADQIHLDYSWAPRAGLTEESLSDGALLPGPTGIEPAYQPAWFAPADSPLAFTLGVPAAKRYCTGARFGDPLPIPWARVHPELAADDIDWDGDPDTITATNHDANFDNALTSLGGFSDWDNIRLNQTGAVVTGVTAGSAEGLYFDNAGTFNGAFFDSSGAFFDASGAWFDASGTWFDNAGGVFWDSAGAFFDAAGQTPNGVYFDNAGAWFDNFGGAWFDNVGGAFFDAAGGVYFDNANGVYFDNANGAFFDAASGSSNEVTYETSLSFGRGRPHKAATCVIDETTGKPVNPADGRICSTAAPFDEDYHRIELHFQQLQVGGISVYEIERKSTQAIANTPDATFATAGTVAAHLVTFTDPAELADGVVYTYRVRGLSTDEFGNSGWSRPVTETAVNLAPEAADDGPYTVAAGSMLTVSESEGVLTNDREIADVDSPATSRSVFSVVTNPEHGELAMNADGSFTYTPEAGYVGPDSFQYVADNGPWSGDPENVRLSPPSNTATVSINVTNDPPSCAATLTASVLVGSTTLLTHNCSDPNGQTLLVTGAGPVTGGGSVALTNPVSASFSFTAPTTATTATFTYTVSDGIVTTTGNATITVTLPPPYGFVNVQNLPPPANKTQKTGSTVPMKWQWTQNGVPVNTVNQAMVRAYACNASPLAPGTLVGVPFTPAQPGSGNSFSYTASNNTWTFSWKLWYSVNGVLTNLPVGTYVVQVQNSVTQQKDPVTVNTCGTLTIPGALITVVK
jgi:hypothetical protein